MTKQNKKKCTHEGHYKSAGIVTINKQGGVLILVALFCEKCGDVVVKDFSIQGKNPPPLGVSVPPGILRNMKKYNA